MLFILDGKTELLYHFLLGDKIRGMDMFVQVSLLCTNHFLLVMSLGRQTLNWTSFGFSFSTTCLYYIKVLSSSQK